MNVFIALKGSHFWFLLDVPEQYRSKIEKLVLKNQDLFASKDSELGHKDTIKMQIDIGNNVPIKMKP